MPACASPWQGQVCATDFRGSQICQTCCSASILLSLIPLCNWNQDLSPQLLRVAVEIHLKCEDKSCCPGILHPLCVQSAQNQCGQPAGSSARHDAKHMI